MNPCRWIAVVTGSNKTHFELIVAGDGNDASIVDDSVLANLVIVGSTGNDTIIGGNVLNIILGNLGDDNSEGGDDHDSIMMALLEWQV